MTDRITNSMVSQTVLSDIQNVYAQLTKSQEELSSGKQLTKPSDNPFATSRALLTSSEIAANKQYQTNVSEAGTWLSTTDTALASMSDDVQRVRDLVLQGANGAMSQTDRDAIADELDQIADSVKTAANTQYAGRYVFSGTKTDTPPFQVGGTPLSTPPANDAYAGNSDTINREIGQGVQVSVNVTGDTVATPILAAIRQASTDLRAGGTPANLSTTDLQALDTVSNTIATTRASVGARQNRLTSATDRLQQLQQAQTQQLSDVEDVDIAQAMIDYSTQSAVYQAALQAGARLIQPSLMNFLQ